MSEKSNSPWISVNDRLPERTEEIFITAKDENGVRFYGWNRGYLLIDDIERGDNYIDYWMHIPKID